MKFLPILLLLASFTFTAHAQKNIELAELNNHVNDSVTVKGKIFGVRYLEAAKNTPTFINIGAAYPNQLLTVVIWGDVRKKLGYAPEDKKFAGGMATITGTVTLYKGKPQIVITASKQLQILYDEEVPQSELPDVKRN